MESPIQHKKARSGTFRHEYTKLIINELRLYHFSLGTFGHDRCLISGLCFVFLP